MILWKMPSKAYYLNHRICSVHWFSEIYNVILYLNNFFCINILNLGYHCPETSRNFFFPKLEKYPLISQHNILSVKQLTSARNSTSIWAGNSQLWLWCGSLLISHLNDHCRWNQSNNCIDNENVALVHLTVHMINDF